MSASTVLVPLTAAYWTIATVVGTVASAGFYMGSLQRQIEVHSERLHEIDRRHDELAREFRQSLMRSSALETWRDSVRSRGGGQ